jgi:hypothetical protein
MFLFPSTMRKKWTICGILCVTYQKTAQCSLLRWISLDCLIFIFISYLCSQGQNWKTLYVALLGPEIALTLGSTNFQIYHWNRWVELRAICELVGFHSRAVKATILLGYKTVPHLRRMETLQRGCLYFYSGLNSTFLTNHHHSLLHI